MNTKNNSEKELTGNRSSNCIYFQSTHDNILEAAENKCITNVLLWQMPPRCAPHEYRVLFMCIAFVTVLWALWTFRSLESTRNPIPAIMPVCEMFKEFMWPLCRATTAAQDECVLLMSIGSFISFIAITIYARFFPFASNLILTAPLWGVSWLNSLQCSSLLAANESVIISNRPKATLYINSKVKHKHNTDVQN